MFGEQPFNPHCNPFLGMFKHEAAGQTGSVQPGYYNQSPNHINLMCALGVHFTCMKGTQSIFCSIHNTVN